MRGTLSQVERERTAIVRFALMLVIACLAIVTGIATLKPQVPDAIIPALTVTSLVGCLYVIAKERALLQRHRQLLDELVNSERHIERLEVNVMEGRTALEGEQARAGELEVRLRELTALYRAIAAVNAIAEPDGAADSVLAAALDLVGADTGSIMLVDEAGENLVIAAARGLSRAVVLSTRQRIGEGIAGWVAREAAPLLLNGTAQGDERFHNVADREMQVRLSMCVPLQLCGRVTGVINFGVTLKGGKESFSEYDLRLAAIFAQHAAVALEYARALVFAAEPALVP
jgi:transcriptional regulator with GAF, ATPase, and Fis domain